jgi:hypothetical protein
MFIQVTKYSINVIARNMNVIVSYLNCNPVFNMLSSQANEAVTTVVVFGSTHPAVWSYLFISAFTSLFLNSVLFLRVYVCEYQIFVIELCLLDVYSAFNHLECCFTIKHLFPLIPGVSADLAGDFLCALYIHQVPLL